MRARTAPTKWVIGEGEKVPPDSILPASASSVELNTQPVSNTVPTQKVGFFQAHFLPFYKTNTQTKAEAPVDDKKWNPDAQVFVPNFLKTKTPEPEGKKFIITHQSVLIFSRWKAS